MRKVSAELLGGVQGYALDMTKPTENLLRISFAKPLKASDPRSRGPAVNRAYNPPSIGGNRPNERYKMPASSGVLLSASFIKQ